MSKNTMKLKMLLPSCLLLLWTLTVLVSSQDAKKEPDIQVTSASDGIKLSCPKGFSPYKDTVKLESEKIEYSDAKSGEYVCKNADGSEEKKIYVKFRTCDNCVDLDVGSVSGMIVGDVVATVVIGIAVYLIASQASRMSPVTSSKKSSDRQHLVSNEVSSRSINDHYQPLRHKRGQKDTYDVLSNRR